MRIVVTGGNGTVGRVLCKRLEEAGHCVVLWNRQVVPVADGAAQSAFLRQVQPDVLYHLAIASTPTGATDEGRLVNCDWPIGLARLAGELSFRLVFTSTAMVFSNQATGPFTLSSKPDATEGYGGEKRLAEEGVGDCNPNALIVRLGWQIADAPGGNNMLEFIHQRIAGDGEVRASQRWYPACSFLGDTVAALVSLLHRDAGLYMLDSNRGWNFYEIVCALRTLHGADWPVTPTDDFVYDQRLLDPKIALRPLSDRLPDLPHRAHSQNSA